MTLKIYEWEIKEYGEFEKIKLCKFEQNKILRKLSRHFKIITPCLAQSYRRGGAGSYEYNSNIIRTGVNSTLGDICHEFAHHLTSQQHNKRMGHCKYWKKNLKKVYTFAKRYLPKKDLK